MLISILATSLIGAAPTETPGLILKSETAHVKIFENKKRATLRINYSADQLLTTFTEVIHHN